MIKTACAITILIFLIFSASSCDRRGSVNPRVRELPTFSVEMTIVKNLATGENLADAYFERDGAPFSDGVISVGGIEVPPQGGGLYFVNSAGFSIVPGLNVVGFESPEDDYHKEVNIIMPGEFAITQVSPRYNPNADFVFIQWSVSSSASHYILAVSTGNIDDGTVPLRLILSSTTTSYWVADTTFENGAGDPVPGIYFVYLVAYNEGFGPYEGIPFQVPEGLPEKIIVNPSGVLRFGTVADIDSVVVPF